MKQSFYGIKKCALSLCLVLLFISESRAQTPASTSPTEDIGWPRKVSINSSVLVYYQPQIDEWKEYKQLLARVAFSLTPSGGKQVLGVASFTCGTLVDKDKHTVYLRDLKTTNVRFASSLDAGTEKRMQDLFQELVPKGGDPISVDRIMADLQHAKVPVNAVQVKNDPPQIFYSSRSAILLMVEGNPVLAPIDKSDLQFVVNTNWDLFYEKSKKEYFLLTDKTWLTAQELKGPWTQAKVLPKDMSKLPSGQNFDDVKKMIPPPVGVVVPQVFYSSTPAELILFNGSPVYTKIPGTQLLYVANTDNNVFVNEAEKQYYVLLSGRWFRAKELTGPWSYAGNDLPKDFAKIPSNTPKADILASVPGTIEASDAVMLAQIPTTAIVNKKEAESKVKVIYDGEPQFKPIDGTKMKYATNTQEKVIKLGNLYYLCFQAVWFLASSPTGPWTVVNTVPSEIYTIPPSSPVYNITYVTQTNATATTVESSSTGGYMGVFIIGTTIGATIAYGTGYYYPPYMYYAPGVLYPVYRPWPCTYGVGAAYNPWTGGYAVGRSAYGPYGSAGSAAWYNPGTGRYGRSATIQSPYGGRTVASAYNPWTGGYAATSQGHNAYSQWGSSAATRGDQWARTGHITTASGTLAGYQTSSGQGIVQRGANGTIAKTDNGMYAGHDGNIYKKNSTGDWSQYKNGSWNQVSPQKSFEKPSAQQGAGAERQMGRMDQATLQGLDNSAFSRQRGQMQTQRFQNFQRGGGGFRGRR